MQAGADAPPLQRSFRREALTDVGQHRHLPIGPFDLERTLIGQADVADVAFYLVSRGHVIRIASRNGLINPHPPERRRPRRSVKRQYSR